MCIRDSIYTAPAPAPAPTQNENENETVKGGVNDIVDVEINASSFPSTQVFNEMVDLSISMVNTQFKSDQTQQNLSRQGPSLSSIPPLDAMGRYLLHPTEFKELLKAFQSPPQKVKDSASASTGKTSRRSSRRRTSNSLKKVY